jgi:hypothetical protein
MDQNEFATELRRFPSLSEPGKSNVVYLDGDGRVGCTCPGWKYRGYCWHVDSLMEKELGDWLLARGLFMDKDGSFRRNRT